MRNLLILLLLTSGVFAEDEKKNIVVGGGAYFQSQPYLGTDSILLPTPVIFFDNGIFYIRWSRAGVYFLGAKKENYAWGFSITAQPRTYGYKPSDSMKLSGMSERENSWEGGLAFSAKYKSAYIEMMLLSDLLGKSESWMLKTEIGYDIKFTKLSIYPSVVIGYQSQKFINYYYGVRADESQRTTFSQYTPDAGIQIGIQSYINYDITKKLSALINIRADRLPDEATSSPIIENDYIYSGLVSFIYTFDY